MAIPRFQDNLESVNALLIVFKQSLSKLGHFFFNLKPVLNQHRLN